MQAGLFLVTLASHAFWTGHESLCVPLGPMLAQAQTHEPADCSNDGHQHKERVDAIVQQMT
ncbi:hypothetical protein D3C73_1671830 [compost metagenome]